MIGLRRSVIQAMQAPSPTHEVYLFSADLGSHFSWQNKEARERGPADVVEIAHLVVLDV